MQDGVAAVAGEAHHLTGPPHAHLCTQESLGLSTVARVMMNKERPKHPSAFGAAG